ncbi:hypothetical protein ZIOFF_070844 [Zingiber officinale]|uniref:SAM domain-containing protein n=1 Tax=Zingiber officinale TaxID=94328 RepID=A0A8J5C061_ZINOF|nr:hypothetical protein ZIOFF_070844 [Zingiber officinale]
MEDADFKTGDGEDAANDGFTEGSDSPSRKRTRGRVRVSDSRGTSPVAEGEAPSDMDGVEWIDPNGFCRSEEDGGVRSWLKELGLSRYAPVFEIHEVDDEVLPLLTLDDLKDEIPISQISGGLLVDACGFSVGVAGNQGCSRERQVPVAEALNQDQSISYEFIEYLQRQVMELSQRLAAQDLEDSEVVKVMIDEFRLRKSHTVICNAKKFHEEVGTPMMALAVFLPSIVELDDVLTSYRSSLGGMIDDMLGIQLATWHCFILEDPPNDSKDTPTTMSSVVETINEESNTNERKMQSLDATNKSKDEDVASVSIENEKSL